jgi:hypothetical protein
MKKGTYGQKLKFTVVDENNEPVYLAGASVKLYMKLGNNTKEFDCTIEDDVGGIVSYVIQPNDLDVSGEAKMEIEVTFEGQLFVSEDKIKESIKPRIKIEQ